MCTGNFYCDEISTQAVLAIATYLAITPKLVDEATHVFRAYEMPWDVVSEQRLDSSNPQSGYRVLLANNTLHVYGGHACIEAEVD